MIIVSLKFLVQESGIIRLIRIKYTISLWGDIIVVIGSDEKLAKLENLVK